MPGLYIQICAIDLKSLFNARTNLIAYIAENFGY